MEYYSAIQRNGIGSCVEIWIDPECSKSERENQISYIKAYMCNLEKWCRLSYLQSRNRNTDNRHMDTKAGRGGRTDTYTLLIPCMK